MVCELCLAGPRDLLGFPAGSAGKESTCNAGDLGSVPGWGRSPGGGHGNPLQSSCLENPMDRGARRAAAHRVAKSWTRVGAEAQHADLLARVSEGVSSVF